MLRFVETVSNSTSGNYNNIANNNLKNTIRDDNIIFSCLEQQLMKTNNQRITLSTKQNLLNDTAKTIRNNKYINSYTYISIVLVKMCMCYLFYFCIYLFSKSKK